MAVAAAHVPPDKQPRRGGVTDGGLADLLQALQRGATIGRTTGTDADGCSSRDGLGSSSSPGAGSSVAIGAGGGGGGTGGLRSLCLGGTAAGEAALRAVSGLTRLAGAAGPSGRG